MNLAEAAEKYSKYKVVVLLLGIFLLGFAIRYLARGPRIGPELDTWFHFRIVNYILDLGYVPEMDSLSYYPLEFVQNLELLIMEFLLSNL